MGLLIVDAVPAQDAEGVTLSPTQALVLVSVSRAESGQPVTGLNEGNFKVCWTGSGDVTVSGTFRELKLEPGDQSPAGVYLVTLTHEVPVQSGVNAAYGLLVQMKVLCCPTARLLEVRLLEGRPQRCNRGVLASFVFRRTAAPHNAYAGVY